MRPRLAFLGAIALTLTALATSAFAQIGPGMPGGAGGGSGSEEQKPEGVAEEAPKTPGMLPTTPTLPPPKGKRDKFQLLELGGYFRFRGDYFKNFNLGFDSDPAQGGAPFPKNLGCTKAATTGTAGDTTDRPCENSIKSSNIRLRLEPVVHVNESTAVYAQIDVLDNQVLGATPTGSTNGAGNTPLGAFGDGQVPPQAGVNWSTESIRAKRAWAEVTTPLGLIKVGRQPSAWGLGIWQNSGAEDPVNGGYNYDGDYGDTVDRLMFSTLIPGTNLRGAIATDWPSVGPTSATDTSGGGTKLLGQPWDLDDNDDVNQWVIVLSRMDTPTDFRDTIDRGDMGLNYGTYFTYRTEGWDYTGMTNAAYNPDNFVPRDAKAYIPDVWVKLGWHKIQFEAEAVGVIGTINRLTDQNIKGSVDLRQFGGVARLSARALNDDKLKFGVEVGAASGDQNDNNPQGSTNIANANPWPRTGSHTITWFRFDPDYHVDLILWRELYGAVTNAMYTKPYMSYELTKTIALKVANVTSFALKPVATPGNATMYGTEFDADIGYTSSVLEAGLSYGVLFPLGAMSHPADTGFGYPTTNQGDATTAHTLQARMVVKF